MHYHRNKYIITRGNYQIYSDIEKGFWRFYSDTKVFSYNYIKDSTTLFSYLYEWFNIENPIILSDSVVVNTDSFSAILQLINCDYIELDNNAEINTLQSYVDILNQRKPDAIFAIGGGSVLDKAKLVAASYSLKIPLQETITTNRNYPSQFPLIAIPTTFGTGSEVNMISHLRINKRKLGLRKHWLAPTVAIIIAEIALNVPSNIRILCGIDAWLHAIEALSLKSEISPIQNLILKEVLRLHHRSFYNYIQSPNIENSSDIAIASLLSGLGLNNGRTSILHALAGPFEHLTGLSHAESLLPFLVNVLDLILNSVSKHSELHLLRSDITSHLHEHILPSSKSLMEDWNITLKTTDIGKMCSNSCNDIVAFKETPAQIDHKIIKQLYIGAIQIWIK